MISGDNIVKNPDISSEDQREISNILNYFDNYHNLDDVKILTDDFKTEDMEEIFGFKYNPNIWGVPSNERYFYYGAQTMDNPIDIVGYDYYIQINSWNTNSLQVNDLIIANNRDNSTLSIKRNDEMIISVDTRDIALEVIDNLDENSNDEKYQRHLEELSYILEEDGIKIKFKFHD